MSKEQIDNSFPSFNQIGIPYTKSNGSRYLTDLQKQQMIRKAADAYAQFLDALGFDYQNDPHMRETPTRVAKAWVNDLASGCYTDEPEVTAFPNDEGYSGLIIQRDIPFASICAHHNLPFMGKATVAYIPANNSSGKVIGLSKLDRIVDFFARRPNVQESLTKQVHDFVNNKCENNRGVAVIIRAVHTCVSCRGVRHQGTEMATSQLSGYFFDNTVGTRVELFSLISDK